MRRLFPLLFMLCLLLGGQRAAALDLYQGEALVSGPDEASRALGVGAALAEVAVKVSGNAEAGRHPAIVAAQPEAAKLLQRYEYRQELVRGPDGRPMANLYLVASFYPGSVDALLARAGLPVWGRERPTLLVLLEQSGQLLQPGAARELADAARRRGLELYFPAPAELAAEDVAALRRADPAALAGRYGTAPIVLGGALGDGSGSFVLDDGRSAQRFELVNADRGALLVELVDQAMARLARMQLGASSEPVSFSATVEGLQSAADYALVVSYLNRLTPVKSVRVEAVEGDRVVLALTVAGGPARLQQTLGLGKELSMPTLDPAVLSVTH